MTEPADALLASDADRDAAAEILAEAVAQGRLPAAEHEARLSALFTARTREEAGPLTVNGGFFAGGFSLL